MRNEYRLLLALSIVAMAGCEDAGGGGAARGADFGERPRLESDAETETDAVPPLRMDAEVEVDAEGLEPDAGSETACVPDEALGCDSPTTLRICGADGASTVVVQCPDGEGCLAGQCRPSNCAAGPMICLDENTVGACARDESGYVPVRECDADSPCMNGVCESACNTTGKVPSNVGCEYWSVDLDNYPDPFSDDPSAVPHAVAISNTSEAPATVTIDGPIGVVLIRPQFQIPPGDVFVYTFPRLDIDGTGIFDRAFRIRSTQPVIVYQFNPLNNEGVASNDASLLLPAEGLGNEYVALSWPSSPIPCLEGQMMPCLPNQHGYVTIVATGPGNTTVRVTPTTTVNAGGDIPELEAGMEHEFQLAQGEVLNLEALAQDLGGIEELFPTCESDDDCMMGACSFGLCLEDLIGQANGPAPDLTGSIVLSNQPVAVFGGHEQAVVGEGCCAEHLEQQLLPTATWGRRYLAARSEPRGGSVEVWRVVAAVDGTVITTTPAQPESAMVTLNRGEYHQIVTDESFEINATQPVMVGQYLVSQEGTGTRTGDPALIVAPPIEQLRSTYQVITPEGYSSNWLTIARTAGADVRLDGALLEARLFIPFGTGDFELAWVPVEAGVHRVVSERPLSLTIYGYSAAVSYGYPGGLNLRAEMP
ncbi:MAG: IgGFc-binding protein [Bradymonadia bacterium]